MSENLLLLETAPAAATPTRAYPTCASVAVGASDESDDGSSSAPGISRQLRWRRLRKELGLCVQCSKPSPEGTVLCPACSIKHRLKQRKQKGYRSREESGRGRKWKYL